MFIYNKKLTHGLLLSLRNIEKALLDHNVSPILTEKIVKGLMKFSATSKNEPSLHDLKVYLKIFISKIIMNKVSQIDISQINQETSIFVCGINGSGKTSAVVKMSFLLNRLGWRVMICPFDDFRPGAKEQLEDYAKITNAIFVKNDSGDKSYLDLIKKIKIETENHKPDVLLYDTSGRMSANQNLMLELQSLKKNIEKITEKKIHHTIFIFDATVGYNILVQLAAFKELINVTGIIVTKVDLVKEYGLILSAADQFDLKIHGVTSGNEVEKLSDFNISEFVESLLTKIDVGFK